MAKLNNKKKIKRFDSDIGSEIFNIENELKFSESGDAEINCQIGKIDKVFSPYDIAKDRTISESFNSYLMQETEIIPLKHNIEINLHVDNSFTIENEIQIRKALKRYFSFNITTVNVKLRRTLISSIFLYILGAISLILTALSTGYFLIFPLYETLLIVSWFLIWEATNIAFFERLRLKKLRLNMLRIYNANVMVVRKKDLNSN